jgi:hypothetical protein
LSVGQQPARGSPTMEAHTDVAFDASAPVAVGPDHGDAERRAEGLLGLRIC